MEFDAYCVKCRETRHIHEGTVTVNGKGGEMAQGTCPGCGTNVTRFLPAKDKSSSAG